MRFQTKKCIVKSAWVVLVVWPLIRIAIVHSTEFSPWRGFGWGMYAVPVVNIEIRVSVLKGQVGQPAKGSEATVQGAIDRYLLRYQEIGRHAIPNEVVHTTFAAFPGLETIEVSANAERPRPQDGSHRRIPK